jgi:DNA modification methylase/ParB-like chromosome segregation protein Spo0J
MNVELINITDLKIPESRQRQEFPDKHIKELAVSIRSSGLLHAPVVDKRGFLVSGDCRRRAVELIVAAGENYFYNGEEVPLGMLPIVRTHQTEERELYRIELEENVRRRNLTHIEQAQAVAKLHEYFSEESVDWTKKDTAIELADMRGQETLGATETEVAHSIILSQFADDPAVSGARTKASAVRIAKRILEQNFRSDFGADAELVDAAVKTEHKVIQGDSLNKMKYLPENFYDGIITDPPYGIGADKFGESSFMHSGHTYEDNLEYAHKCYYYLAKEGYRVCASSAHCYVFCDINIFPALHDIFKEAGWNVWKTPIIWYKGTTAHSPRPDFGPKRTYEAILFANKGDKHILYCGTDVISRDGVFRDDKLHPAEKPVDLYAELIKWSFMAGSKILDPFCGVFPLVEAAERASCIATGIELEEKYANISQERIRKATDGN